MTPIAARFQREAKTLASLNHANIAGIYGLEESDGVVALEMELVDGAPDGKRVAVLIPKGSAQAPQQEHEIVMLNNFADELRQRVPLQ